MTSHNIDLSSWGNLYIVFTKNEVTQSVWQMTFIINQPKLFTGMDRLRGFVR
jgi:hypothetical protein